MDHRDSTRNTLKIYWGFAKKHPLLLTIASLKLIGDSAINLGVPLIVSIVIDNVVDGDYKSASDALKDVAIFGGLYVGAVLINYGAIVAQFRLATAVTRDIQNYLLEHLLNRSYSFYSNNFSGSLIARAGRFASGYGSLSGTIYFEGFNILPMLLFSSIALMFYDVQIGVVMLVLTSVSTYIIARLAISRFPYRRKVGDTNSKMTGQFSDTITNIQTAKSFANEHVEQKLFGKKVDNAVTASYRAMRKGHDHGTVIMLMSGVLQAVILLLLVRGTISGTISIGVFVLAQLYTSRILAAYWRVGNVVQSIETVLGDAHEMSMTLQEEIEIVDEAAAKTTKITTGEITFNKVDFTFPDEKGNRRLFKQFSLEIADGEKVGLVGHSGGGKSTITKLLLRFYDIQKGSISIGGHDISKLKQQDVRNAIAYVPQDPVLFHRSIFENIQYSNLKASKDDVYKAANKANAHKFIKDLPNGYSTLVGERGVKLSGGQRQRVALARAILSDAPILLLDEATSALDSESEKEIQDALKKVMTGRTVVVIAHRLSTLQEMDRIVVLDNGSIVEDGTQQELLRNDALYAQLWAHQSGGFIED